MMERVPCEQVATGHVGTPRDMWARHGIDEQGLAQCAHESVVCVRGGMRRYVRTHLNANVCGCDAD